MGLFRKNTMTEHDDETHAKAVEALSEAVQNSDSPNDDEVHIHTEAHLARSKHPWLAKAVPHLEQAGAKEHLGNYTMTRGPNPQKQWESMPIYVRLGMHAFFVSTNSIHLTSNKRVERILIDESVKEGKIYDAEAGAQEKIQSFVRTYSLEDTLPSLLLPDLQDYPTFNSFFYRKLKEDARPAASPEDDSVVVSAADCRLTVFETVDKAKEFWIKGKEFTIPALFEDEQLSSHEAFKDGAALAIFRLAPQDYHRWHAPCKGKLAAEPKHIDGQLYTVNPQAINEDFNVFTMNKRDVVTIERPSNPQPIVMVAVGAMLVGSITWTVKAGEGFQKGGEMGYFAYGGSTVIIAFPSGSIKFDEDLVKNSEQSLETIVQVGEQIGRFK